MREQESQPPLRTRTCHVKQVAVALKEGDPVFGRPGIHPFQHLSEVILVPAAAHDDEDVLELGTLDAMLRRERRVAVDEGVHGEELRIRSEEHTSELQSLMRISYAVFCLKKKNKHQTQHAIRRISHQHTHTTPV